MIGRRTRTSSESSQRRQSEDKRRRISEQVEAENKVSKLTEAEEAAVGSVSWSLYGRYFKKMGLWISVTSTISIALFHASHVFSSGELSFSFKFKLRMSTRKVVD